MHSVRGTSDIDVTLIATYCLRSVLRLHPQTHKRVPGQPRFQNDSKSNVSHKEMKCKIVFSFLWNFTPPNQMTPDEATGGHLASSGVIIWPHLAGSGFVWPHLAGLIWLHLASSGLIWPHLASSGLIWRHLASSGAIWPHLASSGHIWRHLASSGLIWPHQAASGFQTPHTLLDYFAVCSIVHFCTRPHLASAGLINFLTISAFALWYHLCTIPCFSVWCPFFLVKTPPRGAMQ